MQKFSTIFTKCSSIFTFVEMFLGIQDTQDTSFLRLCSAGLVCLAGLYGLDGLAGLARQSGPEFGTSQPKLVVLQNQHKS